MSPRRLARSPVPGTRCALFELDTIVSMDQGNIPTRPGNWLSITAGRFPLATSLAGAVLLLCSFPPVGFAWLAWLALIPWLALIEVDQFRTARPWARIWFGGLVFWAAEVYYISIPHWLLWFAWIALSFYLSVYPLVFVWIGRILVHDHRVPLVIAGPLAFTVLEWVRAHLMSGFGFSMLANSQYQHPLVLQICDLAGAYGLTWLMATATVAAMIFVTRRFRAWRTLLTGAAAVLVVACYGIFTKDTYMVSPGAAEINLLVVQGSIDTRFSEDEEEQAEIAREMFEHYLDLQRNGWDPEQEHPDLIIWPEGKYPIRDVLPQSDKSRDDKYRSQFLAFHRMLYEGVDQPPPMIAGGSSVDSASGDFFNSALLINRDGDVIDRYFKIHRVIFGEYVPLQEWFPALDRLTPIGKGLTPGRSATSFLVGEYRFSPSICFESVVSHLIRDSVNELASIGREPDVLVNITDDGWFYGTAVLDHHLACNVVRAVENRKPMVVAANTGLSALIDASGRIHAVGPRRDTALLWMAVPLARGASPYRTIAEWPIIVMTAFCVFAILTRRRGRGWIGIHVVST